MAMMVMPPAPMMMPPMVPPPVMAVVTPPDFGDAGLRGLRRDRCRDAGVDQTGRVGALRRRGNQYQTSDSESGEQFCHGDCPFERVIGDAGEERAASSGGSGYPASSESIPAMPLVVREKLIAAT
jgi:hypothetical protein